MPFQQLSAVRQHYYEHGHGPRTVVFVHGFQASGRIWQLVLERLPAEEYRAIAVDNRGAGQTDAPESEDAYGCKPFADDLAELVTALGLRDFVLVGHSMGGATVMQFAVAHPELLRALVLVDPASPDGPPPGSVDVETLIDERMARRAASRGGVLADLNAGSPDAPPVEFLQALAADVAAAPERRLRGSMRSMLTLRLGERVGSLPMPVLMIGGDSDALIPLPRMLETYAKLPPGSGLHIWHGVGHSPNVETPDRFTRVLRRFIERSVPEKLAAAR
jgi:branched-chain amino acid transport system permease protein